MNNNDQISELSVGVVQKVSYSIITKIVTTGMAFWTTTTNYITDYIQFTEKRFCLSFIILSSE